jgi:hypothetical protein
LSEILKLVDSHPSSCEGSMSTSLPWNISNGNELLGKTRNVRVETEMWQGLSLAVVVIYRETSKLSTNIIVYCFRNYME